MNFLTGVKRLHRELQQSTAAPTSVVGASIQHQRMFDAYADAWRDLQTERDWRWMRNTLNVALTVDQQTYTGADLSAERFGRWRHEDSTYCPNVYKPDAPNAVWPMQYMHLDLFRERFIYRTWGSSTPLCWTFDEQNQLLIGPKPALAYGLRIEYWKEPLPLINDNDEPDLPARFELLPMWAALKKLATKAAMPEVLADAEQQYTYLHDGLMRDQGRLPTL